mgnify:CR=1 FL=1
MLTSVVLESSVPMTLNVGDVDPDDLVVIKSISGLSPADVTLFTGDFARDGGYYQGRRAVKRNPVFNLKLNADYASDIEISDIRESLYRQFYEPQSMTDGLQVRLVDDRKPDRYFIGYTEGWVGEIFDQSPSAQISMICVDPMLKSVANTTGANPAGWVSVPIDYEGSADTGIDVTIKVTSVVNQVVLENNGVLMKISKPTNFAVNDIIEINTVIGSRAITLNGVDIMGSLTGDSGWVMLTQAANTLNAYGLVAADGKAVVTAYSYRASWWGV